MSTSAHQTNGLIGLICSLAILCIASTAHAQWTLTPYPGPALPSNAGGLLSGDVDGDGRIDLLYREQTGRVFLHRNLGPLVFNAVWQSPMSAWWRHFEKGDFNGDGRMDFAIGNGDLDVIYIFVSNGAGFNLAYTIPNIGQTSVAAFQILDWDNDGDDDLLSPERFFPNTEMVVYLNNGSGTAFSRTVIMATSVGSDCVGSIYADDWDGDGDKDIYAGGCGNTDSVLWRNDGPATTAWTNVFTKQFMSIATTPNIISYDIDNDGDRDILTTGDHQTNDNAWYENQGGMVFVDRDRWIQGNGGSAVFWDFDEDGDLDVAAGRTLSNPHIYENQGTIPYPQVFGGFNPSVASFSPQVLDIDDDGDLDLALGSQPSLYMLINDSAACPPETCDGIDNDCDGDIDEGPGLCGGGQQCVFGACFDNCMTSAECSGMDVCYDDQFRCGDPADPCNSITCPATDICFQGACFKQCGSDAQCDPLNERCFQSGRCGLEVDPCAGVQCPVGEVCYAGSCFRNCNDNGDCTPPNLCYDNRCTDDPCAGVDCPVGEICYGGSCFESCGLDSQCDPGSLCYDAQRCAVAACEGVQCPSDEICYGGTCFDPCFNSGECGGDSCFDDHCASDPCDGVQCGTDQACHQGTCFDVCGTTADCDDPNDICYDSRCVDEDDPECDGVVCANELACYRGECFETCNDDGDCSPPNTCYQGSCVPPGCPFGCRTNETCYQGACFPICTDDGDCSPPNECYEGRCAANACEALADTLITDYDTNHPFRDYDKFLLVEQDQKPWHWIRPVTDPTGSVDIGAFADITGGISMAPVHQAQTARMIVYLDPTDDRYYLWLSHGASAGQGAATATYSIRGFDATDNIEIMDDTGDAESYYRASDDGSPYHLQVLITTDANETGGVVIGPLERNNNWSIEVYAAFSGDITTWESYNGEEDFGIELNPNFSVRLANTDLTNTEPLTPFTGLPCIRNDVGICQRGTALECVAGEVRCYQTVSAKDEICDGLDNDCDGLVDDLDPDLEIPVVFARADGATGYLAWPTYDTNSTVADVINYTAHTPGDDREGSANVIRKNGMPLQTDPYRSYIFAHRNLDSGAINGVMVHGQRIVGAAANSLSDQDVEFHLETKDFSYYEEMFISFYDDRAPFNSDDKVVDRFDDDDDRMELNWKVKRDSMGVDATFESDSAAVQSVWSGDDVTIRYKYKTREDEDDVDMQWRAYAPVRGVVNVPSSRVRFKIVGLPPDETFCAAATPSLGCEFARYECTGGKVVCGAADPSICGGSCIDADGDGYAVFDADLCPTGTDCDDSNPAVNPGADEQCNGIDDDCDGNIDLKTTGCPGGAAQCGPAECGFAISCQCPDGPDLPDDPPSIPCQCGAGLEE